MEITVEKATTSDKIEKWVCAQSLLENDQEDIASTN